MKDMDTHMTDETLLNIDALSLEFRTNRGQVKALRDISFPVKKGRILGIVGESGSGKSTVLWSILGLLAGNAKVTAGRVDYGDRDLLTLDAEALRALRGEEVSVVFQDPMTSQIPVLPYARQMSDILSRRAMSEADKRAAAVDMLRRVGIPDPESRVDAYPHQFSGGMRQRAGIAMSMLTGPNLLLADEPTTALDVTMEAQMIGLMRGLRDDFETTIVVVSHNLGLIAEMCDDVVVMYAGEVVEAGEVHDIFHNARHPYTRALLECDPARIADVSRKLPVIPGDIPDLTRPLARCIFASRCQKAMPACATTAPPLVERGTGVARCHLLEGPLAAAGLCQHRGARRWRRRAPSCKRGRAAAGGARPERAVPHHGRAEGPHARGRAALRRRGAGRQPGHPPGRDAGAGRRKRVGQDDARPDDPESAGCRRRLCPF